MEHGHYGGGDEEMGEPIVSVPLSSTSHLIEMPGRMMELKIATSVL